MFILALVAALTLATSGNGGQALADRGGRDPSHRPVARFLERALPERASGTLVAARGGELLHCRGFGLANRKARVAAGCDTVYDSMSMTKQFTAAAILKLEMMGELRVTDRIAAHLGPVPRDKRRITLGYEQFLARHLFAAAGVRHTGYVLPHWNRRQVAVEYDARGRPHGRPFDHPWAGDGPHWNLRGNGGMLTTARDMFRWHLALERNEVLGKRAKRKLFKPHVREEPGGPTHYGYGWVITQPRRLGRVAWHNGGNNWSYGEVTRLLRPGVMVFWVTNRYRSTTGRWDLSRFGPRLTEGVARRAS